MALRDGSATLATPRTLARSCQFCRRRKIKCDALKPTCTTCRLSNRTCSYQCGPAKPRPSTALLNAAREEKNEMQRMLVRLKLATTPAERDALLNQVDVVNGKVNIREGQPTAEHDTSRLSPIDSTAAAAATLASLGVTAVTPPPSHARFPRIKDTESEYGSQGVLPGNKGGNGNHSHNNEYDDDDEDFEDDYDEAAGSSARENISEQRNDMGTFVSPSSASTATAGLTPASMPSSLRSRFQPQNAPEPGRNASQGAAETESLRYQLIANAAMSRQQEYRLRFLPSIRGVPTELALHLLDLHWNRQHHTYLLTYRPVFMRELLEGGDYCTDFLLYSVFACSSKFSERVELRTDPADPDTTGRQFFDQCETIMARDAVLGHSRIPTIIGLLMLGSTYNARGDTSKGWLYTGYAVRMVYDLGLHLDNNGPPATARTMSSTTTAPEELEIRRRVFWGAFICEKLQSIYLGRPATIQLRDAHASRNFLDTFEELEPWAPYADPKSQSDATSLAASGGQWTNAVTHSVSVFQQLCQLAIIMTNIINKIYFATDRAARKKTARALREIDDALIRWYHELPPQIVYEPWSTNKRTGNDPMALPASTVTPNIIILHTTYYCLIILLHCPFISSGTESDNVQPKQHGDETQDHSTATYAWKRCTTAARNITNLALAYRSTYPLRRSNYMLSYAVYVACTIHVHNAAAVAGTSRSLSSDGESAGTGTSPGNTASVLPSDPSLLLRASLVCLDELAVPNSGVADTARIIRKLMAAKSISEHTGPMGAGTGAGAFERRSGPQFDTQYMPTRGTHDTSADDGTLSAALTMPLSFDTSWQLFNDPSPGIGFESSTQFQSFSDFGLTANGGHDLLFGFMDGSFSPNGFMGET
ncbi:nitrogen assimilation transcription factor nira [Ophiostoma piceae UAMH 11346]|uniref:Nitrogen assimilation transcription factor nira n=1 Tax=Ophiostoma piceae (strain UAMH 11346) TaxID=1262450 RepID=S3CTV4_OPHP1|nr:nitrogen assimilation transcription factor nira [Ophiostoma piceae UAMH 11346]